MLLLRSMSGNTAGATTDAAATTFRKGNGRLDRAPYDLDTVLDIAVATFNERGYEATSISVLAERLGTSKSALYYHVSGKEELLRRALDRALDGLEAVVEASASRPGTAAVRPSHLFVRHTGSASRPAGIARRPSFRLAAAASTGKGDSPRWTRRDIMEWTGCGSAPSRC